MLITGLQTKHEMAVLPAPAPVPSTDLRAYANVTGKDVLCTHLRSRLREIVERSGSGGEHGRRQRGQRRHRPRPEGCHRCRSGRECAGADRPLGVARGCEKCWHRGQQRLRASGAAVLREAAVRCERELPGGWGWELALQRALCTCQNI